MDTVDFKKFGLRDGDCVLDLGCGEGRHVISVYYNANVHSVGVDLCHPDLVTTAEKSEVFIEADNDQKQFSLAQCNGMKLPFDDNTFDKVICSEVLEHIPDYEAVLDEIHRVLRPGGYFCASVPRYWPEKICWALSDEYHANEGGHLRIFDANDLRQRIERRGLTFYARHWAHALHSPYWWLKCLNWEKRDSSKLVKLYQRFLEWDIVDQPRFTRVLEAMLNPLFGKSVVMYFRKGVSV